MPHFTAHCAGRGHSREARRGTISVLQSVALEVASFGFGITIIEPGGARTEFHDGGARVAKLMPIYYQTPTHSFLGMLDPKNGLAPGDQERMAARIIGSVNLELAPLRLILGSQAFEGSLKTLCKRMPASKDRPNTPFGGTFRPRRDIYSIFFTRYDHLSKQIIQ
jgi:hypothetical protein